MPRTPHTLLARIPLQPAIILLLAASLGRAVGEGEIDFGRDVQPILSDRCYTCHGPDEKARKAKLRLDLRDSALDDRDDGAAIVPGDPAASLLVERILSHDADDVMPPAKSNKPLSEQQKRTLQRWIEEGAPYDTHWSFAPIVKPVPPGEGAGNPIDHFVRANLHQHGIKPAPEANRATWLRRVTLDLTGLPPSIEDLDFFLADVSSQAYEKVVDRLLGSSDYAERMAAIWLDNARYADSNGYQFDNARTMWPWRDWVIGAYRKNMPFDQFVTEQLAGDLLPGATQDQKVATGFNRNHGFTIEGGVIDEEYRVMYVNDRTTTAGTLFLGLTFECSRCHDHKYDPISIKEYYSLYAFFNSSADGGVGTKGKPIAPAVSVDGGQVMVMQEKPRKTHVLTGGQFDQHGEEVCDTPAILPPFGDRPRNRLGLAEWLTDDENPLLARVTVNRVWQQLFGFGLFKTVDNLGIQGEAPSHPEMLDWLAADFRNSGWDMHHLIRGIVLSATYRGDSKHRPELEDPDNRLLARGPSFRLPAETIRDQALAAGGLLTRKVGGASVMPYQPAGIWEDLNAPKSHAEVYQQSTGAALYRKSMYTYWRRAAMHPAMAAFDAPSRDVCSVLRATTNTPLQALALLHDPTYIEAARKLAELALGGTRPEDGVGKDRGASTSIGGVRIEDVSSEYSAKFPAGSVVDGTGLDGDRHGAISDGIAWLNAGVKDPHADGLGAQITFDLGANYDVASMRVWNYNESRRDDLSRRGAKDVEILIAPDPARRSFRSVGTVTLEKATGQNTYAGKVYPLAKLGSIKGARLIRFNIKSNHGGDADLIGLSEVQFVKEQPVASKLPSAEPTTNPKPGARANSVITAMRRTLSREPTEREMALLGGLARARLAHYKSNPGAADKLLAVGESPIDPELDRAQLAAMTDVCLAIFNLSETITRK